MSSMRKHYLYKIDSSKRAPVGEGDAKTWFFFYKWPQHSDEYWLPRAEPFLPVEVGDVLWIVIDNAVFGCVTVDRVLTEVGLSSVQEIWYQGSSARRMKGKKKKLNGWQGEKVARAQGERWFNETELLLPPE